MGVPSRQSMYQVLMWSWLIFVSTESGSIKKSCSKLKAKCSPEVRLWVRASRGGWGTAGSRVMGGALGRMWSQK